MSSTLPLSLLTSGQHPNPHSSSLDGSVQSIKVLLAGWPSLSRGPVNPEQTREGKCG